MIIDEGATVEQNANDRKLYEFDFSTIYPDLTVSSYSVVVAGATDSGNSISNKVVSVYITGGKTGTTATVAVQAVATNTPTLSHTIYAYIKFG